MLIGIAGKMGSGKTTVAHMLAHTAVTNILPFAAPLKDFARKLGWNGEKDEKGRRLLQLLGTECGRMCIHPDIWVRHWEKEAGPWINNNPEQQLIADDVRFENEATAIRRMGGKIVHVVRPGFNGDLHKSEGGIKIGIHDESLLNDRHKGHLQVLVAEMHSQWREEQDQV